MGDPQAPPHPPGQGWQSPYPPSLSVQKGEAHLRFPSSKAFAFLLLPELDSQAELTRFSCGLQPRGGRKTSTFAVSAAGRAQEGGLEAPDPHPPDTSRKATPVPTPAGGFIHGVPSREESGDTCPSPSARLS